MSFDALDNVEAKFDAKMLLLHVDRFNNKNKNRKATQP
jgi:hypothetical protein